MNHPPLEIEALAGIKTRWPDTTRAKAIRLIQQTTGGAEGLKAFLATRQPDLGNETGAALLERQPDRLLSMLEAKRRKSESEMEVAELLADLRSVERQAR